MLLVAMLFAVVAPAVSAGFNPLVTTTWLSANMNAPGLVVLDIREKDEYSAGHIPGALNLPYSTVAVRRELLATELPEMATFEKALQQLGVNEGSTVIVYASKLGKADNYKGVYDAFRTLFTLKYAGLRNAGVLDGGLDKWLLEKKPVNADIVQAAVGSFKAVPDERVLATRDEVLGSVGKEVTIVDLRGTSSYFARHIKGAVSIPAASFFNEDGTLRSMQEIRLYVAPRIGTDLDKPVIVHCTSGWQSPVGAFVLKEMLGYKDVATFDGSSQEFVLMPTLPLEP